MHFQVGLATETLLRAEGIDDVVRAEGANAEAVGLHVLQVMVVQLLVTQVNLGLRPGRLSPQELHLKWKERMLDA